MTNTHSANIATVTGGLSRELAAHEHELNDLLVKLARDPGNADLRARRDELRSRTRAIREELDDYRRAAEHASKLDEASRIRERARTIRNEADTAKRIANERIAKAKELDACLAKLVELKADYDLIDARAGQAHAKVVGAIVPAERRHSSPYLVDGGARLPLVEQIRSVIQGHADARQQSMTQMARSRADMCADTLDREIARALAPIEAQEDGNV